MILLLSSFSWFAGIHPRLSVKYKIKYKTAVLCGFSHCWLVFRSDFLKVATDCPRYSFHVSSSVFR